MKSLFGLCFSCILCAMFYVFIGRDYPDSLSLRLSLRDAHLQYVGETGAAVKSAGPLLDENGQMCGSLLIFEMDSEEDVRQWSAADPYTQGNLFSHTEILPWKWTLGAPVALPTGNR